MPLIKRKPVTMVPLPKAILDDDFPPDTDLYCLKATGELFLDYASYADRMTFYLQKVFVCEYSGRSGLDYFEALDHEYEESKRTQEKFPEALKPKILRACQFQIEGRQDKLGEAAFERFSDRFFLGERIQVVNPPPDWPSSFSHQNWGLIIQILVPDRIANLVKEAQRFRKSANEGIDPLSQYQNGMEDYFPLIKEQENDAFAHCAGTRLELPKTEADMLDPSRDYRYAVRLMEGGTYSGPGVILTSYNLTRDRQSWNKNLLKRFIKETMTRDPAVGSPWMVKKKLALLYRINQDLPEEMRLKSAFARDELLTKRKKGFMSKRELAIADAEADPNSAPKAKKAKAETPLISIEGPDSRSSPAPTLRKLIKYPIDDLELDPRTIMDGRVLRSKHSELTSLPVKPTPQRTLPVSQEHFARLIQCWNFLNIFGSALLISPFTLDDFVNALHHDTLEPRCNLLGEIHSVLSCGIASEGTRVAGSTQANLESMPHLAATVANNDGMTLEEREKWIRKALDYSRGWDRRARPKAADGRRGWESHLCGVLTQRGGLELMPTLPLIFRHLFTNDDPGGEDSREEGKEVDLEIKEDGLVPMPEHHENNGHNGIIDGTNGTTDDTKAESEEMRPSSSQDSSKFPGKRKWVEDNEQADPETRYFSLSISEKLDILDFLVEMSLNSKAVRNYMDDCELRLTEERKEKADINKARRDLMAERIALRALEKEKAKASGVEATNGDKPSSNTHPSLLTAGKAEDDDSISVSLAASDRDDSEMLDDEPSSRQPSSSPLPDLDGDGPEESIDDRDELEMDRSDGMETSEPDQEEDDVGSDVDELQSSSDEAEAEAAAATAAASLATREAKRNVPRGKNAKAKEPVDRKLEIEDLLEQNRQHEDDFEREWRRHREVAKIRPMGVDRFYQRYWWYDGIGPQVLVTSHGKVAYGTGRLFIQGPSRPDWAKGCDESGGEETFLTRRQKEEGFEQSLQIDEWGFYDNEEEFDMLMQWLNTKGIRENHLRSNLAKWKHYIVEGAKNRQIDLTLNFETAENAPIRRTRGGNRGRSSFEQIPGMRYLAFENTLAQK